MTMKPEANFDFVAKFVAQYQKEYGFVIEQRPIIIDDVRVRAIATSSKISLQKIIPNVGIPATPVATTKT